MSACLCQFNPDTGTRFDVLCPVHDRWADSTERRGMKGHLSYDGVSVSRPRSDAEEALAFQLRTVGIRFEREFIFAAPRKWRADFLIGIVPGDDGPKVLVEVDGGSWTGGRHTSGTGFEKDAEKASAAAIAGYRVIRCTPRQVESGECLRWIESAR